MLYYANMPKIVDCRYNPIRETESIKFQLPASRLQSFIYISSRADVEELKAFACTIVGREFDLPRCTDIALDLSTDLPQIELTFGPPWYDLDGRESYLPYNLLPIAETVDG